jgi:hypothetical protein
MGVAEVLIITMKSFIENARCLCHMSSLYVTPTEGHNKPEFTLFEHLALPDSKGIANIRITKKCSHRGTL